ncbi:hypothetical protein ACROYT_G013821 [Oculina patagonica]
MFKTSGNLGTNCAREATWDRLEGQRRETNMASQSHYNCCVPLCNNSFRNAPELHYYRIPKEPAIRKQYVVLIRNETLKLDKECTRICSAHYEGGEKFSRTHLPSRPSFEEMQKMEQTKRKSPMAELPLETNFEIEEHSKENLGIDTHCNSVEIQTIVTGPVKQGQNPKYNYQAKLIADKIAV